MRDHADSHKLTEQQREKLVEQLKQANPVDKSDYDLWVREEGQRFLDVRLPVTKRKRRSRTLWATGYRAIAVGAFILTAIAVLAAVSLQHGDPFEPAPSVDVVTRAQALSEILVLANTGQPVQRGSETSTADTSSNRLVDEALEAGILAATDEAGYDLAEPITHGVFATWLWRAFGARLALEGPPTSISSEGVPSEQHLAVSGLVEAGIVSASDELVLKPDNLLAPAKKDLILDRIEAALKK